MDSIKYIEELNSIPCVSTSEPWRDNFSTKLAKIKTESILVEATCASEFAMRHIFDERNIPDDLFEAYRKSFTQSGSSLYEHYLEMSQRGEQSLNGFISALKGKLFEMRITPLLGEEFPDFQFTISDNPINPIWDIVGVNPDTGEQFFIQAKMCSPSSVYDVIDRMQDNPNILFAVSDDLADRIVELDPTLTDQIWTSGFESSDFTEATVADLETLAENKGIDVPDELGEILPYVTEIVLAIRLLFDIIKVHRDYKDITASNKTKICAFKLIMLMARFGVSSVCIPLGGLIGTAIPIPIAGTITGVAAGMWFSVKVNKYLKPHFEEISLWLMGLSQDDIFYLKHKRIIDNIGLSMMETSNSVM